jgi:hypothetical protein
LESGKDGVTHVEMGVASEARRTGGTVQKKKQRQLQQPPPSIAKPQRQSSVTSAAHLISNLSSSAGEPPETTPGGAYHLGPSAARFVKPQLPLPSAGHKTNLFPAPHGFSTFSPTSQTEPAYATSSFSSAAPATGGFTASKPTISPSKAFSMKIVAPEHDAATRRGKFPEPSPAACGKRKLAEIAAARMLAGVAASGDQTPPPRGNRLLNAAMDDGTATPPPFEEEVAMGTAIGRKHIPAPPIALNTGRKPLGLSLQIVNPDSLGVSYDQQQKRRRDGQGSPQTPWEGQLQALVRYVLYWKTLSLNSCRR